MNPIPKEIKEEMKKASIKFDKEAKEIINGNIAIDEIIQREKYLKKL